jgi:hypothetical protein
MAALEVSGRRQGAHRGQPGISSRGRRCHAVRGLEEDLLERAGQVTAPDQGRRRGQRVIVDTDPDHVVGARRPGQPGQPDQPGPGPGDDSALVAGIAARVGGGTTMTALKSGAVTFGATVTLIVLLLTYVFP